MSKTREPACIVCGCTREFGCDVGCEWMSLDPPVCSACASPFAIAGLWHVIFQLEPAKGSGARLTENMRRDYGHLLRWDPSLPSLKKIRQINRKASAAGGGRR